MTINNKITGKLSSITTSDAGGNITGLDNLGNVQLGNIDNVHIQGGNLGQFLQTDGNGNLNWGDSPSPVSIENGTSNVAVAPSGNVTVGVAGTANVVVIEDGTVVIKGNIVPSANTTFSLGNSTNWFTDLWLGANTLRVGGLPLSTANGELFFNGSQVIAAGVPTTGNIETSGDITANNAAISNSVTTATLSASGTVTANAVVANVGVTTANLTATCSNLGAVANVTITGGSNGQFLQTDGNGDLSFATVNVGVESFNTRIGNVTLESSDVITAMGYTPAPLASPSFTGTPTAPTVANVEDSSGNIATTGFVQSAVATVATRVITFEGRSGNVTLANTDIANAGGALLDSPTFTGTPSGPTPPQGDSSTRFATTEFVVAAAANVDVGVSSFEGRTGAVTLEDTDVANALGYVAAPIENPTFTGAGIAPTPAAGDNSQLVATTAFVEGEIANIPLTPPGGSNLQLQYNLDGEFGGSAAFAVDPAAGNLSVGGNIAVGANAAVTGSLTAGATQVTTMCVCGAAGIRGALNMNGASIVNVNNITINDPGVNEGIIWNAGNCWKIYESPDDLTNNSGNLQIVQNTTRRATFNTSGQIDIPVITGTAPLKINSTTRVANLNVDCAASAETAASATIANTVVDNAQPNITSVGTLASLSVTGTINAGENVVVTGDVSAANLTVANANLGNTATANFFVGDGSGLSNINVGNIIDAYGNDDVANYLPTYTGDLGNVNDITANNITATLFTGNGSGLTDIATAESANTANTATFADSANVANTANVANNVVTVNAANVVGQVANALVAATVYEAAQPNITSIGTLLSLDVTANITAGNVGGANLVSATFLEGTLTANSNSQPNITSVGTLTSLAVTGNITGGNVDGGNLITANYFAGTLTTAAQPNVTSVGTLTDLAVAGNTTTGNLTVTGIVNIGDISLDEITANSANISNVIVANGNITGANNVATGNLTVASRVTACRLCISVTGSAETIVIDADNKTIGNVNAIRIADPGPTEGLRFDGGSCWVVSEATNALDNAAGNLQILRSPDGTLANLQRVATFNTSDQFEIPVANGVAPFVINSCTQVANLNATLLQGRTISSARTPSTIVSRDSSGGFAAISIAANTITANENLISEGNAAITGNLTANNVTALQTVAANTVTANVITTDDITAANLATFTDVIATTITATTDDITVSAAGVDNDVILAPTGNGAVSVSSKRIINLATPVNDGDAATKLYVDSNSQGLDVKASVAYGTVAVLPAYTYNNGTAGVGATITANAVGALSLDGSTPTAGDRVLIKDETGVNAPYNGIYVVTTVGDGSTAFVLTRATDFDQGTEVAGAFTFITGGATLANSGWVAQAATPTTIGTTDITFAQFSAAGTYSAGSGLTLTGEVFSVNVDNISTGITAGNVVVRSGATLTNPNITNACGVCLCLSAAANIGTLAVRGGTTINGALNMCGSSILGVNSLTISDPGVNEGIIWNAGNCWKIYESPDDLTNSSGNLQIVQNNTRRATFNTSGQIDIPVGDGTAPLLVASTTRVANLNVATAGVAECANVANVANTVAGSNVTGQVANALVAGTVYTNAQPNITSVGTLASLDVTGNIGAGNVSATRLGGSLTTNAQPNITSVGTLTSLAVTGNVSAANVVATRLGGSLTTAAQPNVTSVGTLTALNVAGNVVASNANLGNAVRANFFIGDGGLLSNISGGSGSYSDANVANYLPNYSGNMNCVNTVTVNCIRPRGSAVRFGINAGICSQGGNTVAIGWSAGSLFQDICSVAVGVNAGCEQQGACSVAIGNESGCFQQNALAVAIGPLAGCRCQGFQSIAIGQFSGSWIQGSQSIALGAFAGCCNQGSYAVAIGYRAGDCSQGTCSIILNGTSSALNHTASGFVVKPIRAALNGNCPLLQYNPTSGEICSTSCVTALSCLQASNITATFFTATTLSLTNITVSGNVTTNCVCANLVRGTLTTAAQPNVTSVGTLTALNVANTVVACAYNFCGSSVRVGGNAGSSGQCANAVAIGINAGCTLQANSAVAIGSAAGRQNQCEGAIAVGELAGTVGQSLCSVAIGVAAGQCTQGTGAVAVGRGAGTLSQGCQAVAIGQGAGSNAQTTYGVAIGVQAGCDSQGCQAVAIGPFAARFRQSNNSVAVGYFAGQVDQGTESVAVGSGAAFCQQGQNAVAIGVGAAPNAQGNNSVAIGAFAGSGSSQANNTIIINATGANLVATVANTLIVKPIRNVTSSAVLQYNAGSGEIVYSTTVPGTLCTAAQPNITSVGTLTNLCVAGNVEAGLFVGNGAGLTCIAYSNLVGAYSNSNVASFLPTYTGDITANTVCAVQLRSNVATGTAPLIVTSNTVVANLNADLLDGYNSSITNVANTVVVRGAGGCFSAGVITATLNGGACRAVTVTAAAQPNITSVGTLTTLSVTGNVTSGNLSTGFLNATGANLGCVNSLTILGGANGQSLVTDGSGVLSWATPTVQAAAAGSNTEIQYNNNGVVAGAANLVYNGITTIARCFEAVNGLDVTAGALNVCNNDIRNVSSLSFNDPGPNEGLVWNGGNCWKIYESPDDLTNAGGNLQIVQNVTRRATFNTNGQLDIAAASGTAPLIVCSNTMVANLNANFLDGACATVGSSSGTVVLRGTGGLVCGTTFCGGQLRVNSVLTGGSSMTGTQVLSAGNVVATCDVRSFINTRVGCCLFVGGGTSTTEGILVGRSLGQNYNFNTVLGCCAGAGLTGATTSAGITAVGHFAGAAVSSGDKGVFVGQAAGTQVTCAINSILIGDCAGGARTISVDELYIGALAGSCSVGNGSCNNTGIGHGSLQRGDPTNRFNTAVGRSSGQCLVGTNNIAIGSFTAARLQGLNNVVIGDFALCTTSPSLINETVAIGSQVQFGQNTISVCRSVVTGYQSVNNAVCVFDSIISGYRAGDSSRCLFEVVAIGTCSLGATAFNGASGVIAIGACSMRLACSNMSPSPVVIGTKAAANATIISATTAVGTGTLSEMTSTTQDTAVGFGALSRGASSTQNTALGYFALAGLCNNTGTIGCLNTAIGWVAGSAMGGGCMNTLVGAVAGCGIVVGRNNTVVGACNGDGMNGSQCTVNIGTNNLMATASATRGIYIGTCVASLGGYQDEIVIGSCLTGKGSFTSFIGGSSGAFNQRNVTTWNTVSDQRIKKEIVDNVTGLDIIEGIRVRDFKYKSDEEMPVDENGNKLASGLPQDKIITGPIAQELREVLPTAVDEAENGVLSVSTDPVIWALVNAVKELSAEVKELKRRLDGQ
jgi:hypothetical protein